MVVQNRITIPIQSVSSNPHIRKQSLRGTSDWK